MELRVGGSVYWLAREKVGEQVVEAAVGAHVQLVPAEEVRMAWLVVLRVAWVVLMKVGAVLPAGGAH